MLGKEGENSKSWNIELDIGSYNINGMHFSRKKYILSALEIDRLSGSYFFSMPLAIAVFGIALSSCWKNKVFAVIATFGRKYSLIFYIIHPLFSRIEYKIFDMNSLQQYLGYIFVVLGSLTFSILYVTMKEKERN